ncbi:kinase-like protein [Lentinula detonsa]|uniref:non-specific serine/threonine protein kinase n=1 Tax=Lentinula detonsa TaxID=2804962 RepID=A0AA38PRM2_9AGAR|nr:kinase-like protein [Lentinula detonsa]
MRQIFQSFIRTPRFKLSRHSLTRSFETSARISVPSEPKNQHFSVGADGKTYVDLEFVEEALGMPAKDGYGWARFESGDKIGPGECYTVLRKLGWGGYSSTWLARDNKTTRYVAVKALTGHYSSLFRQMPHWEPYSFHLLTGDTPTDCSPHCIKLLDEFVMSGIGSAGQHYCLVTPLYGGDLLEMQSKYKQDHGRFPPLLAKRALLHVLRGIAYAHSCGVIHTDIKLNNVFFDTPMTTSEIDLWLDNNPPQRHPPEMSTDGVMRTYVSQTLPMIPLDDAFRGTFVLGDFGAAIGASMQTNHLISVPLHRAPEVYLGAKWGEKVDIWSFGTIVFELVVGERLFQYQYNKVLDLDETENILFKMICLTGGNNFRAEQLNVSPLAAVYFDEGCVLKKNPRLVDYSFEIMIGRRNFLSEEEVALLAKFLRRCLQLDPLNRPSAKELLEDPWFDGVD